ncbi:MAG: glutamate racemase [Acholeplasmataceae bacterium]
MAITIGLFDSGLGGLTILRHLQKTYSNVNYVYVADYAYNPYGIKDFKVIEGRVKAISKFLENKCDVIVIACNTASIHINSIKSSKKIFDIILPTAYYAIAKSKGRIGVLATDKTIQYGKYQEIIEKAGLKVIAVKASEFVDIIESNKIEEEGSFKIYQEKMQQLKDVDTIILGCTHFELIKDKLREIDDTKNYITSGTPIASLLKEYINNDKHLGKTWIYLTKSNEHFIKMVANLNINYESIMIEEIE